MTVYNTVYYFSGNLTLTVDRKVRAWRESFAIKYGEHAILSLSLEDITPAALSSELSTPAFLANARLIILRGSSIAHTQYGTSDFWTLHLKRLPENTFIVFAHLSSEYDELINHLQKNAQIKSYHLEAWAGTIALIQDELPSLSRQACTAFAEAIGDNPLLLQSELAKFALVDGITDNDILKDIDSQPERMVFKSIDALLASNPKLALTYLALDNCSNSFELFGEVLRALRKGALFCALIEAGIASTTGAETLGLKEYPAKKYGSLPRATRQAFVKLYIELTIWEVQIKTGWIKIEDAGIEAFITTVFLNYHFSLIRR